MALHIGSLLRHLLRALSRQASRYLLSQILSLELPLSLALRIMPHLSHLPFRFPVLRDRRFQRHQMLPALKLCPMARD